MLKASSSVEPQSNDVADLAARTFWAQSTFEVTGEPVNIEGATQLAVEDPYQFQWWILDRIGARPVDKKKKKGADSGIDGELFFAGAVPTAAPRRAIISVKAGKITPAHVRELRGVIEREGLEMGDVYARFLLEFPDGAFV